ncbi:hypothetical protein FRX31_014687, partial [Thalictrum thalictroides]
MEENKNPSETGNMATNEVGEHNMDGGITDNNEGWETPRKKHTARFTTVAECEESGMTVVQ